MFYLKYRPQLIDELDLLSVRERLSNILSSDSLPHALTDTQESQLLQGSPFLDLFLQLMNFAIILAALVLPAPRGPVKRKACGRESLESILESLSRTESRSSSSI